MAVEDGKMQIRQELSEMTFEELQQLKEEIGTKMFDKAVFEKGKTKTKTFHRANKNRPREQSAKIPVPRGREVIQVEKKISRDPRFDSLSGTFDEKIFKHSYKFLNDLKAKEKEQLKTELEKERVPERKEDIKKLLTKMENQAREEIAKEKKTLAEAELKKERITQLKQGQKPYYKNQSSQRSEQLAEKFIELKKSNKLDKYLIRKRKKIAHKERKQSNNRINKKF